MMKDDITEYQELSEKTAKGYADPYGVHEAEGSMSDFQERALFLIAGLNGESGELSEKIKKFVREDDDSYVEDINKEMGDVLWYLAQLATLFEYELGDDVAFQNLQKLTDRDERGVIFGDGDDR